MICVNGISKTFDKTEKIIDNFNYKFIDGDFVCLCGRSGSGKTTLLNIISLLEKPTSGDIIYDGKKISSYRQKLLLQRYKIGYLFQNYALINNETVYSNLNIAFAYKKVSRKDKETMIQNILQKLELKDCLKKKVFQLSGGEQQRIAIARMILKDPQYIFADEPTGNLDTCNRDIIFNYLKELNQNGKTVIYVSHDEYLIKQANNIIRLD